MDMTLFPHVAIPFLRLSLWLMEKVEKKRRRKEALFLKKEPGLGVMFPKIPTSYLLVSNGGLENGISRDLLESLLHPLHLHMPSGKDYAFAEFSSAEQAERVVRESNGMCVQEITGANECLPASLVNGPPLHLYLSYISQLPQLVATPPSSLPPGLVLVEDFLTPAEEAGLMTFFDSAHSTQASLRHRQVLHYGFQFNYDTNSVDPSNPLPGGFPPPVQCLVAKLLASGHVQCAPDQLTVNCYPPGAGIPPHVDTHSAFLEDIVSVSLGSQVVMDFREPSADGKKILRKVPVVLHGRSLLVMRGPARYLWSHGIATRHYDQVPTQQDAAMTTVPRGQRVSLTFRTVRQPPTICTCNYPLHCDSQQQQSVVNTGTPSHS